jgi:hypothetical protein
LWHRKSRTSRSPVRPPTIDRAELEQAEREVERDGSARALDERVEDEDDWGPGTTRFAPFGGFFVKLNPKCGESHPKCGEEFPVAFKRARIPTEIRRIVPKSPEFAPKCRFESHSRGSPHPLRCLLHIDAPAGVRFLGRLGDSGSEAIPKHPPLCVPCSLVFAPSMLKRASGLALSRISSAIPGSPLARPMH